MTNETFRILLKVIAAFALTASFGSASFAGEFTVREGKRYCATLALKLGRAISRQRTDRKKISRIGLL